MANQWWAASTGPPAPRDDLPRSVHRWYCDGYFWRCQRTGCTAAVPSELIGETSPPNYYDPDCRCTACLPCKGEE